MKKIKVKCAHLTRFGKLESDYLPITLEAVARALDNADIERICNVYLASYAPAELCDIENPFRSVMSAIEREFPALHATYHGIFKTGGEALYRALVAMDETGSDGDTLVVGSEKMTHLDPRDAAGILSAKENPHDRAYGATLPSLGALVTRSYLGSHKVPEEALHLVAVKNHRNGASNPKAHFKQPVTLEDVAASPLVADPLRRLHCAPISDGAAAVVLSRRDGEVEFRGWGKGYDTPFFQERRDIDRFLATAEASRQACAMARTSPGDIDVVEIHDAFSSFELINLEEMGFYPPGQSWRALEAGELDIGGRHAINPSGGMKAKGHPIGATGVSSTVEVCEQLLGRAGARQHAGAALGMIQSVGGVSRESYVFVLGRNGR